jgi:hypothetical protein
MDSRTNQFKFKLHYHYRSPVPDGRYITSFIFHPNMPFIISVYQPIHQTIGQPTYIFHYYAMK